MDHRQNIHKVINAFLKFYAVPLRDCTAQRHVSFGLLATFVYMQFSSSLIQRRERLRFGHSCDLSGGREGLYVMQCICNVHAMYML